MKQSLRINFDDKEGENLDFLMQQLGYGSPQKLIRALVMEKTLQLRSGAGSMGGGGRPPTTNRAHRRAALEAMDDASLTAELDRLGLLNEFKETYHTVRVESNTAAGRILRLISDSMDEEVALQGYMNKWEKLI